MITNIDLEQAVLGTIFAYPEHAGTLVSMLDLDDLASQEHRALYEAIILCNEEGRLPSPATITPQLGAMSFAGLSPAVYIGRLLTVAEPFKIAIDHIRALKDLAARRSILGLAQHMTEIAPNLAAPIASLTIDAVSVLDDIRSKVKIGRQSLITATHGAQELIKLLEKGEKPDLIKTGLSDLDRVLGGWHRGELCVIAGRPSMGKSAALFSAMRRASMFGTTCAIFSLEMRREAVLQRMLSDAVFNSTTPIEYARIARQDVDGHEIGRLRTAAETMRRHASIHIDDQAALTVSEIAARARRIQEMLEREGKRLDVIVIDHLGKIAASNRYAGNKVHETGEKTAALAVLARELNVAVVVAHQLNRGVEGRDEKRPGLADLRDSGDVEQDADTVIFIYRAAYYLERAKLDDPDEEDTRRKLLAAKIHDMEWIIAKNRNGPCCTLEFYVDMGSNVVRDRSN